jgi:hypothetical protein
MNALHVCNNNMHQRKRTGARALQLFDTPRIAMAASAALHQQRRGFVAVLLVVCFRRAALQETRAIGPQLLSDHQTHGVMVALTFSSRLAISLVSK